MSRRRAPLAVGPANAIYTGANRLDRTTTEAELDEDIKRDDFKGEEFKRNVTATSTWLRALHMLLFGIIFYVAEFVLLAVALVQLGIKLFTGAANQNLATFGAGLGDYFRQIVRYLCFDSDERPFPFAPWPGKTPARGSTGADNLSLPESGTPPPPRY